MPETAGGGRRGSRRSVHQPHQRLRRPGREHAGGRCGAACGTAPAPDPGRDPSRRRIPVFRALLLPGRRFGSTPSSACRWPSARSPTGERRAARARSFGAYAVGSVMVNAFGIGVANERAMQSNCSGHAASACRAFAGRSITAAADGVLLAPPIGFAGSWGAHQPGGNARLPRRRSWRGSLPFIGLGFLPDRLPRYRMRRRPWPTSSTCRCRSPPACSAPAADQLPGFVRAVAPWLPSYHYAQLGVERARRADGAVGRQRAAGSRVTRRRSSGRASHVSPRRRPQVRLSAQRSPFSAPPPRVQEVAQGVAHDVEGQHDDQDGEAGQEHDVRAQDDELPAGREHAPPVGGGRLRAEPEEGRPPWPGSSRRRRG